MSRSTQTENQQTAGQTKHTPIFARHETFHPRFGWIKKGFDKASIDNEIFTREEAPVILGVGKNMVKAIRYWCHAFKVLEETQPAAGRARQSVPAPLGTRLIGNNGWDEYLEDTASLWLLHWNLLKEPCQATAWNYAFNVFAKVEFTDEELFIGLKGYAEKEYPSARLAESSFNKDVNCILRMYSNQELKVSIEESVNSPFTELGLIQRLEETKRYAFVMGEKPGLPPEIVLAACLEYAGEVQQGAKTIALSRLLYEAGSPGLVFKLTERALSEAIEKASNFLDQISLSETAGIVQLSYTEDPKDLATKVIESYYEKRTVQRR